MNTTVRTAPRSSFEMLREKLRHTLEMGGPALVDPQVDGVERLDQKLRTLDSLCRETFQDTLADAYEVIARKLESGEALTSGEHKAVELLFTGEAEYYLKTENNFHDWIAELNRLLAEMAEVEEAGLPNLAELMHLQALCRDAMHVTPEVIYYLRERQRVAQFRASLEGGISKEGGRLLARMIRDLMASPHR